MAPRKGCANLVIDGQPNINPIEIGVKFLAMEIKSREGPVMKLIWPQ